MDAWKGRIDEAAMWTRPLSHEEINGVREATLRGQSVLAAIPVPVFYKGVPFRISVGAVAIVILAWSLHRLSNRYLRRRVTHLELQSQLDQQRHRLSEDIHDELGARLVKLALLSDLALAGGDKTSEHLRTVSRSARDANRSLDELVWALNPRSDKLNELADYLSDHAAEFVENTGLLLRIDIPTALPELSLAPQVRHELLMASKEALTNIVKHANATEVGLRLYIENFTITIQITDNGSGIPAEANDSAVKRNGIRTMCNRLERLGGKCQVTRRENGGTIVELVIGLEGR